MYYVLFSPGIPTKLQLSYYLHNSDFRGELLDIKKKRHNTEQVINTGRLQSEESELTVTLLANLFPAAHLPEQYSKLQHLR